jgi:two-component system OmpR family sensor kinase
LSRVSLRVRLALFGAAVVALALLLFGLAIYVLVARSVETNQDKELTARAAAALRALSTSPAADLTPRPPLAPVDLRNSTEVFIEVLAPNGSLIYSTGVLNGAAPAVPARTLDEAARNRGAFVTQGEASSGGQLRLFALPFPGGYVVTGQSTRVPQSNLSGIVGFLIISGIPTLLAALGASWLVAGRALKPLKEVAGAADEIGRTRDFGRRLSGRRSRDEVAVLAASFNRMLDELQDAYRNLGSALDAQRRFVADASHELRTPLTTIQGNAGLLAQGPPLSEDVRRGAATDIAAESDRMARLVDRMLTLARADSGLNLELAPVDLRALVTEVCRQAGAVYSDRTIEVEAGAATVAGDQDALRQLLWILLDNARRHARSRVSVRLQVDGDWARVMVGDDGAGIPAGERERVFERFYRADPARTGHGAGLGLSIARWITDQHRGRIVADTSPDGGAGLIVDLPLLRSS